MSQQLPHRVRVIDSHTAGEPTRVVLDGLDLGQGTLLERRERFRQEHDGFRTAVILEPRGWESVVGALVCPPCDPANAVGVIFFNNIGYLNMCGHGTIGLIATLAHLGRIGPGELGIETPVGTVRATLDEAGRVTVRNVPSYRLHKDVPLELADGSRVVGDVAWGGNWFYIVRESGQRLANDNLARLRELTWQIRHALERDGITGEAGGLIDHIVLLGPAQSSQNHARNFVLCPGGAHDRSPCGTGTSALLACLAADGDLAPGEIWRQESVIGSLFEGRYEPEGERVIPSITGSAWITAETTLVLDPTDPFRAGISEQADRANHSTAATQRG